VENAGGTLAFGSDWPVVTLNPWPGVQNALTDKPQAILPGFVPKERIVWKIQFADTRSGHFAGHREKTEGSLEAGKAC
jgi:predicted amidohydrolase YtcJ